MALREEDRANLEQILAHLGGLFGEIVTFRVEADFLCPEEDESLTHFAKPLQNL